MRRKTEFVQGHYYHIYNRGANRQPIFRADVNYVFLLRRVKKHATLLDVSVIAYCLMPNHYHFLLRQDGSHTISAWVQAVFNSYTKAFNKMFDRGGTLFEGPFRAVTVDRDEYLVHLCRYIHLNPVRAKLVQFPEEWPYSNYREWIGQRAGALQDEAFIREWFPSPQEYRQFVMDGLGDAGRQRLPQEYLLEQI